MKKCYGHDDIEYKGIRKVGNLSDLSTDEDYYKPLIANDGFNSNYIEYESKGISPKSYKLKNIFILSDHI